MPRLTYATPLLMISVLALTACPGDDVPADTEGTSTGDIDPTTSGGPTTTPPTTTTVDPDTTAGSEDSTTIDDPCADVECPPGEQCIAGSCFTCPQPTCEQACEAGETCQCPADDECCDVGECTPLDCPAEPLPGNYEPCLGADGVPSDAPCDGAGCVTNSNANPTAAVCVASGCEFTCQCPPAPGTGEAVVACEDVTGDDVNDCWLDCSGGAACPDDMVCFGGFICLFSNVAPVEVPLYGDCYNEPGATCENGGICLQAPTGAVCSVSCADVMDCQPAPATGNAPPTCSDVTGDMMPECWLGCTMGEACPDGMECFGGFVCVWPEIVPPPEYYGDCANLPAMCEAGEDACLTDGGMPASAACSQSGCADATECPAAPATGDAVVSCVDFGGGNTCYLDCSMGQTCPDGMGCTAVGMGMACLWPFVPQDFTCSDGDLVSAVGAAVAMGSTVGAGDDFAPSCSGGGNSQDVQFQWTAPAGGSYTFDTVGSDFDTILFVLTDCVGPELVCNDDTMGLLSEVTVDMVAGQSVLIVIDGWNETGNYVLNIN